MNSSWKWFKGYQIYIIQLHNIQTRIGFNKQSYPACSLFLIILFREDNICDMRILKSSYSFYFLGKWNHICPRTSYSMVNIQCTILGPPDNWDSQKESWTRWALVYSYKIFMCISKWIYAKQNRSPGAKLQHKVSYEIHIHRRSLNIDQLYLQSYLEIPTTLLLCKFITDLKDSSNKKK